MFNCLGTSVSSYFFTGDQLYEFWPLVSLHWLLDGGQHYSVKCCAVHLAAFTASTCIATCLGRQGMNIGLLLASLQATAIVCLLGCLTFERCLLALCSSLRTSCCAAATAGPPAVVACLSSTQVLTSPNMYLFLISIGLQQAGDQQHSFYSRPSCLLR